MVAEGALRRGRDAFHARAWGEAYAQLSAADACVPLDVDDLERLAMAAHLLGRDGSSTAAWVRAHRESLQRGETARAARCGFWLAFALLQRGEVAQFGGWLSRAHRLIDERGLDCCERGYLLFLDAMERVLAGDVSQAHAAFSQSTAIGVRFGDTDLVTIGRQGEGRTLIYEGQTRAGMALLDEAMVAVTAGDVSAILAGDVYCSVIEACHETFDLRRAQQWTAALSDLCDSQPDLVLYRGQCLVHRAEIMQLRGEWPAALEEACRAVDRLSRPPGQPALGAARYRQAELHRLSGDASAAEEEYRLANASGRPPQPGLALLWMADGRVAAAASAIRGALDAVQEPIGRPDVLRAFVEIMLAAGDAPAARGAADELRGLADDLGTAWLHAVAAHAHGAVLVTEDEPRAAIAALREAGRAWQELGAPYEAARAGLLLALAHRVLGDEDTATMEIEQARAVFARLGAGPALARLEQLAPAAAPNATGGLTSREAQVLTLVATGMTNREIAAELFVSEHTIARHIQNIFTKLDVTTRTAASAVAHRHGLL